MNPQVVFNLVVLVAVLALVVWAPDRVSLLPLILSRVDRLEPKRTDGTRDAVAVPAAVDQPAKPAAVDPNKTVVMDRPPLPKA
jgi:hypothetical protein